MVPVEMRQEPHVSFTQLDQYLRCPLRYRFTYVGRVEPDFVPAALAKEDLRLRFDVLTKTKQPELHRYWTTRDGAATRRLFRLATELLRAIEAGVFHPNVGWHCRDCPFRSRCWAWG